MERGSDYPTWVKEDWRKHATEHIISSREDVGMAEATRQLSCTTHSLFLSRCLSSTTTKILGM